MNSGSVLTCTQTHVPTPYFLIKQNKTRIASRDLVSKLRQEAMVSLEKTRSPSEEGRGHPRASGQPLSLSATAAPVPEIHNMVMTVTQQAYSISEPPETFSSSMLFMRVNAHMLIPPVRS